MSGETLRLGTRGSALALVQARWVERELKALDPALRVEVVIIKTTGDKFMEKPLAEIAGKGVFIKELEDALLEKRVDLAVHSLKDLPTEFPSGLRLSAVLEREDPRDCVISRFGEQLLELPRGAIVGTSSLRRQAQILAAKKNIQIDEMRGNLDTRIKKVLDGQVDSIVVACAGVRRLGRESEISEVLPFDLMLPAPGQGCVGVEIRENDKTTRGFVERLNHAASARAAAAERAFLAALGGGCRVPIAAYARDNVPQTGAMPGGKGSLLVLEGLVISTDGKKSVRGRVEGDPATPEKLGAALAEQLKSQGALEILSSLPGSETKPVVGL